MVLVEKLFKTNMLDKKELKVKKKNKFGFDKAKILKTFIYM